MPLVFLVCVSLLLLHMLWEVYSTKYTVRFNYTPITCQSGVGVIMPISPLIYFFEFSALCKHTFAIEYHVYISQVSPQLSCGSTCQIWMWFKESDRYSCKIENFSCGEINERRFSNPHPGRNVECPLWSQTPIYVPFCPLQCFMQCFSIIPTV